MVAYRQRVASQSPRVRGFMIVRCFEIGKGHWSEDWGLSQAFGSSLRTLP